MFEFLETQSIRHRIFRPVHKYLKAYTSLLQKAGSGAKLSLTHERAWGQDAQNTEHERSIHFGVSPFLLARLTQDIIFEEKPSLFSPSSRCRSRDFLICVENYDWRECESDDGG